MAVEPKRLPASREGRAEGRLALEDVCRVPVQRDVVDVEMGVRVIAEVGAGVEPQVEDLTEALDADLGLTAGVDEAGDGYALVAKRLQETLRHGADAGEVTRAAVTASGQIVDRDRDLPAGGRRRDLHDDARQENAQLLHAGRLAHGKARGFLRCRAWRRRSRGAACPAA